MSASYAIRIYIRAAAIPLVIAWQQIDSGTKLAERITIGQEIAAVPGSSPQMRGTVECATCGALGTKIMRKSLRNSAIIGNTMDVNQLASALDLVQPLGMSFP